MMCPPFGYDSMTLRSFHDAGEHAEAFFPSVSDIARVVWAKNFFERAQQRTTEQRKVFPPHATANVLGREMFDGMSIFP